MKSCIRQTGEIRSSWRFSRNIPSFNGTTASGKAILADISQTAEPALAFSLPTNAPRHAHLVDPNATKREPPEGMVAFSKKSSRPIWLKVNAQKSLFAYARRQTNQTQLSAGYSRRQLVARVCLSPKRRGAYMRLPSFVGNKTDGRSIKRLRFAGRTPAAGPTVRR